MLSGYLAGLTLCVGDNPSAAGLLLSRAQKGRLWEPWPEGALSLCLVIDAIMTLKSGTISCCSERCPGLFVAESLQRAWMAGCVYSVNAREEKEGVSGPYSVLVLPRTTGRR